jgi:hypothetical protein
VGLIIVLMLSALVAYGGSRYISDAGVRGAFHRQIAAAPLFHLWTGFGVVCVVTFLAGVQIPAIGLLRIPVGSTDITVCQAAGIGALTWMVPVAIILFAIDANRSRKER